MGSRSCEERLEHCVCVRVCVWVGGGGLPPQEKLLVRTSTFHNAALDPHAVFCPPSHARGSTAAHASWYLVPQPRPGL
jgi:hypothetical protein